jgi:branched-chain amino acid transport system substrate-binding protein
MITTLAAAVVAALVLGVAPPTDPAAEHALAGAQAYLAYVGAHGGVRGRTVEIDPDADPAQVVATFRVDAAAPPPRAEGEAYGRYLAAMHPGEKVAVLYSADPKGRALLAGLRRAKSVEIVATELVDPAAPDPATAVANLAASGATVLCVLAPAFAADAYAALGQWRPQVVAAASAAVPPTGTVSAAYLLDGALYRRILATYVRGADPRDLSYLGGMAAAFAAVDVLRHAGANPTRSSVAKTSRALNEANNPFLLSGVKVQPSAKTARLALARFAKGRWMLFGGLIAART